MIPQCLVINTMYHPDLTVSNFMTNSIGPNKGCVVLFFFVLFFFLLFFFFFVRCENSSCIALS